ncbi:MAG: hypothetical protein WC503_07025 [Candidatus Shapirobacteria bacterium]
MWLLLFLLLTKPAFAQTTSPDLYTQYRTDYFFQRDLYQKDYIDYQNKSDTYNQYGSVTAQNDKIIATKTVFLSQNSMLKAYLMALRTTLGDSQSNQGELLKLENWLATQNQLIPNLNSTSALKNWAETFQVQYVFIQKELYTAIIQSQINRRIKTIDDVKKLADLAKVDWTSNFSEKENKIYQNFQLAIKNSQRNQRETVFSDFYFESKDSLNQADFYLKKIISDLKSIVIKNNQ